MTVVNLKWDSSRMKYNVLPSIVSTMSSEQDILPFWLTKRSSCTNYTHRIGRKVNL